MSALEKYFGFDAIRLSWERYIRESNRDVKDYFGIEMFQADLSTHLNVLSNSLIEGSYKPSRPQKFYEPKPSGTQRTKTILGIEDALVYQAIANCVAAENYSELTENSEFVFGSVLHKEVEQGLRLLDEPSATFFFFQYWPELYKKFVDSVNNEIKDETTIFKFETDITGFFDCIPHSRLLLSLHQQFDVEKEILDLFANCLNIWSGTRENLTPGVGIPQGPQPSSFFANVYLHHLDHMVIEKGYSYYRYMDDIRIYSENEQELRQALVLIDLQMKNRALALNSKKTKINQIEDREQELLKTFDFFVYDDPENDRNSELDSNKLSGQELEQFSDQEPGQEFKLLNYEYIDDSEVHDFCEKELTEVAEYIEKNFSVSDNVVALKGDPGEDFPREAMKLGYRYRNSLRLLNEVGSSKEPNPDFLPIWLFLADKVYWKINQFIWIVNLYPPAKWAKDRLLELYQKYEQYEWVQHQIIAGVAVRQEFSNSELRYIYKRGKDHPSFYVRLAFYKLLLFHTTTRDQLFSTVTKKIQAEENKYLREVLFLEMIRKERGELTLESLAESLGMK